MTRRIRRVLTRVWVRPPAGPVRQTVLIELFEQAGGVSQSFLIMSGDGLAVDLIGYVESDDGPRLQTVPVTLRARVA
jgi:hypothetical protein